MTPSLPPRTTVPGALAARRVLVVGFARTGRAVASALAARRYTVTTTDDSHDVALASAAAELGIEIVLAPGEQELAALVRQVDAIVVSPGVPPSHPVFALAEDRPVLSELELASRLVSRPLVAITGTNGKTTVTTLVTAMLQHSGVRARAVGNIGTPLIDAVDDADVDVLVCEVSSFQLALCDSFRPHVATWLNLSEDHLDWHRDLEEYAAAKARIWRRQDDGDVAVANAEDPTVMAALASAPARRVTFGRERADYTIVAERFRGPSGVDLGPVTALHRQFPHDRLNALAAFATALEAGANAAGCSRAIAEAVALPHRVSFVGSVDQVDYYDDSKATTPSAVAAALVAFRSVVLIAGGRNKGLDLSVMRECLEGEDAPALRGVIAIGEAADDIAAAFSDGFQVTRAASMADAVRAAAAQALPGDVVLLSPGCASFDWYRNYEERGEDFGREVARLSAEAREEQRS